MSERPQHLQAFEKANEIRGIRAKLRGEVRRSQSSKEARALVAVMLEDDRVLPLLGSLRVDELLRWKGVDPGAGGWTRVRMLEEVGCSEFALVRQLTARQLDALCVALRLTPDALRRRAERRREEVAA